MMQMGLRGGAVLCLLVGLGCQRSRSPQGEGETHWLTACVEDADCGEFDCVCGLCTAECAGDRSCGDKIPARCFHSDSPGVERGCAWSKREPPAAICLPDCGADGGCGAGQTCLQGACIGDPASRGQPPDAGETQSVAEGPDPLDADRGSLDPRDFVNTQIDLDLDQPPVRPPRILLLPGRHPELQGTWREDCSGGSAHDTCATIRLEPSEDGVGLLGVLELDDYEPDPGPDINGRVPASGPYPAPDDPDVGYPEGMDTHDQLDAVQRIVPAVPYPLLDPVFNDGVLSTWTAPQELWNDWCELQASRLLESPSPHYSCLPEDSDGEDVPPLRFTLCQQPNGLASVCHCSAEGCVAASHNSPYRYRMTLHDDGTATVESLWTRQASPAVATYRKATP